MRKGHLKCGCIPNQYWCSKHDIYTGNTPPWGAGSQKWREQHEVFKQEWEDKAPQCCSCHISAPCSFCEMSQNNLE